MFHKTISSLILVLLIASVLVLSLKIRPASGAETTIYINADGSITPSSAPISTVDNVTYTLTGNIINESIVIERNNIVIDGNGYTVQGDQSGNGLSLTGMDNVKIENVNVESFSFGIFLFDSNNNIISGNIVTANYDGIYIESSSNNIINSNNATANIYDGIRLNSSSYNILSGNNAANNNYYGVDLGYSSNNTVSGNNAVANSVCDLTLSASNGNTIFENNITQSYIALGLYSSSGNNFFGNTITNNDRGVFMTSSSNNIFYHNNFANIVQIVEEGSSGVWDHGYPSGGNYWSDYTGVDLKSGPNQDQNGSDGIGDTPYVIGNNNTDHYPLMMPWTPYNHDVAANDIAPSKTVIGEGFGCNLTVAVANFGENAETFNVTTYANSTAIGTQLVVNLATASPTILTFTWNTTGLTMGDYVLNAYAWPVSGETYTADNNVTGGTVRVTIPGDINGDFKVNLQDLILLANAYGSKPGDKNWNPSADITGDNIVGPSDLAILINHFGQSHPP
jgi:parallel beta-helix repeat protein